MRERLRAWAGRRFHSDLIRKTNNFDDVTWLGEPIWQNVLDLWTIQEAIAELRPSLLVETGTNRGGSARFYAHLFDLMGQGEVFTSDVERLHHLEHPRVTAVTASSLSSQVLAQIEDKAANAQGPVMVILDSDHSESHVKAELDAYHGFVTAGSLMLVQDGVIDVLPMLAGDRPGPLPAIKTFLAEHPEFTEDHARNERFLITHHPSGWLRRSTASGHPGAHGLTL